MKIPLLLCFVCLTLPAAAQVQSKTEGSGHNDELTFVVYLSRHGVRSPTGKSAVYNAYSSAPWPTWKVAPGYLTPHGFELMRLFGAYDRAQLVGLGLLHTEGCEDAAHITVYADSDQRTRETGKALAEGLLPGCALTVQGLPEGTNDPLFHFAQSNAAALDPKLATAALSGRIGEDPANPTAAYRPQIVALDHLLASCGSKPDAPAKRTSLLEIPATLAVGEGDHLAEYKGPLTVASTLSENLLLEYTEGMDAANVGWGCVDGATVRTMIGLHTAATDYTQRTTAIAAMQASNLVDHIVRALEQAIQQKPIAGALAKPSDRALFLIGHDTNLENIAGMLGLNWIADGRRDDTPPGSAFVFELWKSRATGEFSVRTYYTAQTLEQMRDAQPLSPANAPVRVPLFVPGCSRADLSCSWKSFAQTLHQALNSRAVATP